MLGPSPALKASPLPPTSTPDLSNSHGQPVSETRAKRFTLLHLLAVSPLSDEAISQRTAISIHELRKLLDSIADCASNGSIKLWHLRHRYYRELEPWRFPYGSTSDRDSAIDHAIKAFDKLRISTSDNIWQKLLPKEERNQGKVLSKLQISNNHREILGARLNGQTTPARQTPPDPAKVNAMARRLIKGNGQPAQRVIGENQQSPEKDTKNKKTPKVGKEKGKEKASNRKVLSEEFVHESDDENDDAPPDHEEHHRALLNNIDKKPTSLKSPKEEIKQANGAANMTKESANGIKRKRRTEEESLSKQSMPAPDKRQKTTETMSASKRAQKQSLETIQMPTPVQEAPSLATPKTSVTAAKDSSENKTRTFATGDKIQIAGDNRNLYSFPGTPKFGSITSQAPRPQPQKQIIKVSKAPSKSRTKPGPQVGNGQVSDKTPNERDGASTKPSEVSPAVKRNMRPPVGHGPKTEKHKPTSNATKRPAAGEGAEEDMHPAKRHHKLVSNSSSSPLSAAPSSTSTPSQVQARKSDSSDALPEPRTILAKLGQGTVDESSSSDDKNAWELPALLRADKLRKEDALSLADLRKLRSDAMAEYVDARMRLESVANASQEQMESANRKRERLVYYLHLEQNHERAPSDEQVAREASFYPKGSTKFFKRKADSLFPEYYKLHDEMAAAHGSKDMNEWSHAKKPRFLQLHLEIEQLQLLQQAAAKEERGTRDLEIIAEASGTCTPSEPLSRKQTLQQYAHFHKTFAAYCAFKEECRKEAGYPQNVPQEKVKKDNDMFQRLCELRKDILGGFESMLTKFSKRTSGEVVRDKAMSGESKRCLTRPEAEMLMWKTKAQLFEWKGKHEKIFGKKFGACEPEEMNELWKRLAEIKRGQCEILRSCALEFGKKEKARMEDVELERMQLKLGAGEEGS